MFLSDSRVTNNLLNFSEGPNLRKVLHKDKLGDVTLKGNLQEFQACQKGRVSSLKTAILHRFGDLQAGGVVSATTIACLKNWPSKEEGYKG